MSNVSLEILKKHVDEIIAYSDDDERAHSMEDELHLALLEQWLPPVMWEEVERLNKADFARWCA